MRSTLGAIGEFLLGDAINMILGATWLPTLMGFEKAVSAGFRSSSLRKLSRLPSQAL